MLVSSELYYYTPYAYRDLGSSGAPEQKQIHRDLDKRDPGKKSGTKLDAVLPETAGTQSKNGSNNPPHCQHPLPLTSIVDHFRCGFCICVVTFVFVMWLLYLCCGFCICVVTFVFVLWLFYLA